MEAKIPLLARWTQSFETFLWHTRREDLRIPWPLIRVLRTVHAAVQDFGLHKGSLHASALTFYTLLSLVPVVAMAFGVAKGFGVEKLLEKELLRNFAAQEEVIVQLIAFANNMLENTKGGLIAGIGVIVLFWSVIKVLGKIEDNFNHIWGVSSRSLVRKLSDYLTIMIVGPMLLIMSGSATVFIASKVSALSSQVGLQDVFSPAVALGLALAPYILIWLLFTLIYMIMPNTKVRPESAILAAVLAGTTYQLVQVAYVRFQIGVTSYNAIYGSFAALPLFLVWLRLSWFIVLFGAEIAHAFPESDFSRPAAAGRQRSMAQTRALAMAICHEVTGRFANSDRPLDAEGLALTLNVSPQDVEELAGSLVSGGILARVCAESGGPDLYQPARDTANITLETVITVVDQAHADPLFSARHPSIAALGTRLDQIFQAAPPQEARMPVRDLSFDEAPRKK